MYRIPATKLKCRLYFDSTVGCVIDKVGENPKLWNELSQRISAFRNFMWRLPTSTVQIQLCVNLEMFFSKRVCKFVIIVKYIEIWFLLLFAYSDESLDL